MKKLHLTDEQSYIFDVNDRSKGTPYNISFEIRFSRHFPVEQLRHAVKKCLLPADISGAKCFTDGNEKHMEFSAPTIPEIKTYNFPSTEQYQRYCDSIPEKEINNRDKLFHAFIYSINNSFNNLHFCFNHLVFDGISGIILYEAIQKVLLDEHTEIHWHPFASHLEKVRLNSTRISHIDDEKFWETKFHELSRCEPIFKGAIGIEESDATSLNFQLDKESKSALLGYCEQKKISPYLVISSALAELLAKKNGCQRISIEIPIGNRVGKEEKNSIGAYEIAAPFTFDFSNSNKLNDAIESAKIQSREFYRHKDFPWSNGIISPSNMEKNGPYTPQVEVSYFCFNKNHSLGFASLHHHNSKSSNLPFSLYISDYLDYEEMSFYYIFWGQYISCATIIEIQNALECSLMELVRIGRVQ